MFHIIDINFHKIFFVSNKRENQTQAYWCWLWLFSICLRKELNFHGWAIGGIYFFFSLTTITSSNSLENLSFLDNSFNSKICSSIVTNKSPLNALITKHSVLGIKHFIWLFKYGW